VVEARLAAGEAAVQAAHYAMLHQGAKGYTSSGVAQRRLREAYFVAIVTPATKQLRKMLADMSTRAGADPRPRNGWEET
jgi:alkylation response protein AidB-like acyl-CoA dehydrogenase